MRRPQVALLSSNNKFGLPELAGALEQTGTHIITLGKTARVLAAAGVELEETGSLDARVDRNVFLNDGHDRYEIARLLLPRIIKPPDELLAGGMSPIDLLYINLNPSEYDPVTSRVSLDDIGAKYVLHGLQAGRVVVTEPSSLSRVADAMQTCGDVFPISLRQELAAEAAHHVMDRLSQFGNQVVHASGI